MRHHALPLVAVITLVCSSSSSFAYMHPGLGQFAERDPLGHVDGMNLSQYVGRSPLNLVDPFGTVPATNTTAPTTRGVPVLQIVSGTPELGVCGAASWTINWRLSEKTDCGGYIVQKLTVTINVQVDERVAKKKREWPASGEQPKNITYWETWYVGRNKSAPEPAHDTFHFSGCGSTTSGSVSWMGQAEFFDNVTPEDLERKGFKRRPAWMKDWRDWPGDLRVSASDPEFAGGTGSLPHRLELRWACPGQQDKTRTEITTIEPGPGHKKQEG